MFTIPDFSKIFHESSKDHAKGHVPIAKDFADWPLEWKTTYYKSYPRLQKIALPSTQASSGASAAGDRQTFFDLIRRRRSGRDFTKAPIDTNSISTLLGYSCGNIGAVESGRHGRAYPSAGGRFPLEVYPLVLKGGEIPAGLYHYNVKDHALDVLWKREFNDMDIGSLFTYEWARNASAVIILTAVFWRNQNKYGERGYRYILLEGGHIGQNICLASEALGLKSCPLAGMREEALERLIDIDGITESVIYSIAIGR